MVTRSLKISVEQIITSYNKLQNATKVANELDIAIATVLKYLRLNNISIKGSFTTSKPRRSREIPIDENELIRLYDIEHIPSTEIAERFNVTNPTILRRLHKLGVTVKPKHGNPYNKVRIKDSEIPSLFKDCKFVKSRHTGIVTCPICNVSRRLTFNRKRMQKIIDSNGRCNKCATEARATDLDKDIIIRQYEQELLTPRQIAKRYQVKLGVIRRILEGNNIFMSKGLLNKLRYQKKLLAHNKGTIDTPEIGDIRQGTDLGYKHNNYYQYVKCIRCGNTRWESKSKVKKYPICQACAMVIMGMKQSGENSPMWMGGLSFEPYGSEFNSQLKDYIKERDNYTCQLCGKTNVCLAVHHIDYDKKNNHETNLVSLCTPPGSCHAKTNHNREYWQAYFTKLIKRKYKS